MKKNYSVPEITVTGFSTSDIITFSIFKIGNFDVFNKPIEIGEDQDHVVF